MSTWSSELGSVLDRTLAKLSAIFNPSTFSAQVAALTEAIEAMGTETSRPSSIFPDAMEACCGFQEASWRVLFNFHLIRSLGTLPSIVGLAWTWPVVRQAHRKGMDAVSDTISALFRVKIYGSQGLVKVAYLAAERTSLVIGAVPLSHRNRVGEQGLKFDIYVANALAALVDLGEMARDELEQAG